ncbi:hypothetical protein [Streptomyces sp. NPDC001604]|uniref:hypothetical protein n=1 Tax=Streptomyces sp. NPDC001604 TaxID=3364593 RepID=UPI0036B4B1E8
MHTSVLSAVQIAVTLGLVAWVITGFTPLPGRWLRWKMFAHIGGGERQTSTSRAASLPANFGVRSQRCLVIVYRLGQGR